MHMAIKAEQITQLHADDVYEQMSERHDEGQMEIEGEKVNWWADRSNVWFYEPGNDGDNTIAQFEYHCSGQRVN